MEGPVETKHSTNGTEEPIKLEVPVHSPGSSNRSDGAASPPPNCSICLGKLVNTSFTDSCLHQFCFTCLLQWSKIKTECPLCKQTFKSIIHNVRSEEDYDQYHVPRELASQIPQPQVMATLDLNFELDGHWDVGVHRFHYRTTMTGNRRHGVVLNPDQVARREQLPSVAPQVSRQEQRRRRANPPDYRRTVYRLGIRATSLPDAFGRFRECNPDFYRREPRELNRLVPWLNRELQVLINSNASHIAYVMRIILDAVRHYDIRSPEFRDIVRPYFGVHADHFVHELFIYAISNFDLVGYDQSVIYLPQGLSSEYVSSVVSPQSSSSSSSSDDSDVRVLDEAINLRTDEPINLRIGAEFPSVGPHSFNMPGPSTVGQAFQLELSRTPDVFTISSSMSSSDDDCEVVGYVKPRHERTPEIIELFSSEDDVNISIANNDNAQSLESALFGDPAQPSTSDTILKRSVSSSTDSDSDSDSDYIDTSRRYQSRAKKSGKDMNIKTRNRSMETRGQSKGSRNLSSSGESESRKRGSRKSTVRDIKKRCSSSSESSSHETDVKKAEDKKSRKTRYSSCFSRGSKNFDKRGDKSMAPDDSSSSDSSSNTDDNTKTNKYTLRKLKRKYVTSSSEFETPRNESTTRPRSKIRQTSEAQLPSKESERKETRYKENKYSVLSSSSESSYSSQKKKRIICYRVNCKRRDFPRLNGEYVDHDVDTSGNRDSSRKEHKSKSKVKKSISSSSDTERDCYRSNSQCSDRSSKSYVHWVRSKHKDRYKSKERNRSSSRTYSSNSTTNNSITSTSKTDTHSTLKHSDSKSSSSKDRHKSHRSRKESKHRRSQGNTKSKSRRRRHEIRSSTSSNSE